MPGLKRRHEYAAKCDVCSREFKSKQAKEKHYTYLHKPKYNPAFAPSLRGPPKTSLPPGYDTLQEIENDMSWIDDIVPSFDLNGTADENRDEDDERICEEDELTWGNWDDNDPLNENITEETPIVAYGMVTEFEKMCVALEQLAEKYHLNFSRYRCSVTSF